MRVLSGIDVNLPDMAAGTGVPPGEDVTEAAVGGLPPPLSLVRTRTATRTSTSTTDPNPILWLRRRRATTRAGCCLAACRSLNLRPAAGRRTVDWAAPGLFDFPLGR